jgi:hypothetical protein
MSSAFAEMKSAQYDKYINTQSGNVYLEALMDEDLKNRLTSEHTEGLKSK